MGGPGEPWFCTAGSQTSLLLPPRHHRTVVSSSPRAPNQALPDCRPLVPRPPASWMCACATSWAVRCCGHPSWPAGPLFPAALSFSRALLTAVAMLRQPPPGRAVLSVYTRFHTGQDASSPPAHAGGAPPAQCRPKSRACCLSRVCWDLYVPPSPAEGSTTPPLLDISSVPPATTQGLLTPTLAVSL